MQLRIRGEPNECKNMVTLIQRMFPDKRIRVSHPYPQTRYNPASTEVAYYIEIY